MTVSELTALQDGRIYAVVQAPADAELPLVEEYLNAMDCAVRAAGYHPVGRAGWRPVSDRPGALEITLCTLPQQVVLGEYWNITMHAAPNDARTGARRAAELAAEGCTLQVPEFAVETEAEFQRRQLYARLEKSHITLQQHLARLRTGEQAFFEKLRGYARQDMQQRCALLAIARAEGFTVTPEQLDAAVRMARTRGVKQPDRMQLRQQLLVQQVTEYVWQNVTVLAAAAQEEQA